MIRVMAFNGPGKPLRPVDVPAPVLADGEALMEVRLTTLCGSDLHTYFGHRPQATPCVLGHEIVATVVAVGGPVPLVGGPPGDAAVGDRVIWSVCWSCWACERCRRGLPQKCDRLFKYGKETLAADPLAGGLATHVRTRKGTALFAVPAGVPDEVAAPTMCAGATVDGFLRHLRLDGGRSVLVVGGGLLGLTLCARLSEMGVRRVTLADPDPRRRELGLRLGATESDASPAGEFDSVAELSGSLGGVRAALEHAAVGGTVVLAGGVIPVGTLALDPEEIVRRCLTIRGVHNYDLAGFTGACNAMPTLADRFGFARLVERTFPLAEADAAFEYARTRKPVRVGVRPNG